MNEQNTDKIAIIQELRPIDDILFEVLARDKAFDEEMLRLLIGDGNLRVTDVIVQSDERNLYGRSVRLDALCTLGDGSKCNIEVQRADDDDHIRRVRYNASMITTRESSTGTEFSKIPEVYVVYISEKDFLKGNRPIYHVEKVIRETGQTVDDGLHEIFVNTSVNDGSVIAEYMANFVKTDVDTKFPAFSNAVRTVKCTKGGHKSMCELMEKYAKEYAKEEVKNSEERFAKLINKLMETERKEDLQKALEDFAFRNQLYEDLKIE